jgi:aldehyde:ferredoxin oxidoreductase
MRELMLRRGGESETTHACMLGCVIRHGWQVGADILQVLGKETITLEREFNRRAGFTAADDRIPESMRTEPLPPHNSVYDTSEADLDSLFNW